MAFVSSPTLIKLFIESKETWSYRVGAADWLHCILVAGIGLTIDSFNEYIHSWFFLSLTTAIMEVEFACGSYLISVRFGLIRVNQLIFYYNSIETLPIILDWEFNK